MIAMSVLLSKVDICVSFSSHRLLMWEMVVGSTEVQLMENF